MRDVPIEAIRCDEKPFMRGFASAPITGFPVYRVFSEYLVDPLEARRLLEEWYWDWWVNHRAWRVSKQAGGGRGGSLWSAVKKVHANAGKHLDGDMSVADPDLLKVAFKEVTNYRISILESIRDRGYVHNAKSPIRATARNGLLYLTGGHHRVAALAALGHETVPLIIARVPRFRPYSRLNA
jgi:hypothetical protein